MAWPTTLEFLDGSDPMTGKIRFQLRPLINWLFCCVMFMIAAVVFAVALPSRLAGLADAVAIAVFFYLNFYVLDKRAIGFDCPHCGQYIATNTPWTCGFCRAKNEHIEEYPF